MAEKPSYKAAHEARKGTATMTIEAAPKTSFTDKVIPDAHQEQFPGHTISPEENAHGGEKALNIPSVHPGEYNSGSSGVTKT